MSAKSTPGSTHDAIVHLVGGAVGGAVASCIVQPLDVIKTRQQQSNASAIKYKTSIQTARTIFTEEGLFGLWKGTAPTLFRVIPGAALYFVFLHYTTSAFNNYKGQTHILEHRSIPINSSNNNTNNSSSNNNVWQNTTQHTTPFITHVTNTRTFPNTGTNIANIPQPQLQLTVSQSLLAGSLSRMLVTTTLHPVSVVKTRFEGLGTNSYTGTLHALRTIASKEGLRGLFSGFLPTVLRDAPFSGVYYLLYQHTKQTLAPSIPSSLLVNFISGAVAGTLSTVITHPQDVIKTRMQLAATTTKIEDRKLRTLLASIMKEEGVKGFFKGLMPRLVRRPLLATITWVVFEEVKSKMSPPKS